MGYSREVYDQAKFLIDSYRRQAVNENDERRKAFFAANPEYAELERDIAQTSIRLTRVMLSGQKDDYLEPKYHCPKCGDTGFIDGKMCSCFKEILRKMAYEELNRTTPLELCSFQSFSLDFYPEKATNSSLSPRHMMENVKKHCWDYANSFTLQSPNQLFQGGVGLGKTHLSLAVAARVISKGYGVIYGSAQNFFNTIESEHFGRGDDKQYTLNLLKGCDLLILDDIGTEFITQFTMATLHDIINTRILTRRPTIISTNLSIDGLKSKYDERISSRISGNYTRVQFVGSDIRIEVKKKTVKS